MSDLTPEQLQAILTPEYRAADNGSRSILLTCYIMLAINTFFLVLFFVSRYFNEAAIRTPMLILIPIGWVFGTLVEIIGLLFVYIGGAGKHALALPTSTLIIWGKLAKAGEYVYVLAVVFPKLAILALYLQVFNHKRAFVYVIYVTGIVVILNCLASCLVSTFICKPFAAYWNRTLGHCGNIMDGYRWISIPSLITDVVILIIPIPALLKVQVSDIAKAGLVLTFLTASLGIVTCILRMHAFFTIDFLTDPSWLTIQPWIFTVLEPAGYSIAAILPTTRHLMHKLLLHTGLSSKLGSIFTSTAKNSKSHSHQRTASAGIELKGPVRQDGAGLGSGSGKDRRGFARLQEVEGDMHNQDGLV